MKNTRIPTPADAHPGSEAPAQISAGSDITAGRTPTAPELTGDELEDVVGGVGAITGGNVTVLPPRLEQGLIVRK